MRNKGVVKADSFVIRWDWRDGSKETGEKHTIRESVSVVESYVSHFSSHVIS